MEHAVVDGKDMPKDRYGYNCVRVCIDNFSGIIATLPGKKADPAKVWLLITIAICAGT